MPISKEAVALSSQASNSLFGILRYGFHYPRRRKNFIPDHRFILGLKFIESAARFIIGLDRAE